MEAQVQAVKEEALASVEGAGPGRIKELRTLYLGRKGKVAALFREFKDLPPDERREAGRSLNELKSFLDSLFEEAAKEKKVEEKDRVDVTLPGRRPLIGGMHPVTSTIREICEIFLGLGYSVVEGPEVELDYYNFEALNIPRDHPARDMQDTFYVSPNVVLRTHTSPMQVRVMEKTKPPVRVVCPGRVYRRDSDPTHSPMFHQVEGLYVDENVSFAELKGTLIAFLKEIFGENVGVRFRPSFFPFTEPSAEVDIECVMCRGAGCGLCKDTGWLEILGSGMVNPRVFEMVGYDTARYRGFAFGLGVERIAMLKLGIDNIRLFFENDLRFLAQF